MLRHSQTYIDSTEHDHEPNDFAARKLEIFPSVFLTMWQALGKCTLSTYPTLPSPTISGVRQFSLRTTLYLLEGDHELPRTISYLSWMIVNKEGIQ